MYFIHDLYNDTWLSFEKKEDLAIWWKSKIGSGFDELNVTGKDCLKYGDWTNPYSEEGHPNFFVVYLRRYQVMDEDGRSIDIRLWDESVWRAEPPRHSYCREVSGSKRHSHRVSGPSMLRSTSRQSTSCVDYNELNEKGLPAPDRDATSLRRRVLMSKWDSIDYYEITHFKKLSCSKSWKDQYKSRKQWGKHKHVPRISREIPEKGEELVARLGAELVAAS